MLFVQLLHKNADVSSILKKNIKNKNAGYISIVVQNCYVANISHSLISDIMTNNFWHDLWTRHKPSTN
jgi:hypothetical protein